MPNTLPTYTLIQTVTINTTSAIIFTAIPQTFTDLKLIINARSTTPDDTLNIKFNGGNNNVNAFNSLNGADSSNLFQSTSASGTGPFAYGNVSFLSQTGFWGCSDVYIADYTVAGSKPINAYGGNKSTSVGSQSMSYAGGNITSIGAITEISLQNSGGALLAQYSTASLYGILKY
jgi:hypothetical protein